MSTQSLTPDPATPPAPSGEPLPTFGRLPISAQISPTPLPEEKASQVSTMPSAETTAPVQPAGNDSSDVATTSLNELYDEIAAEPSGDSGKDQPQAVFPAAEASHSPRDSKPEPSQQAPVMNDKLAEKFEAERPPNGKVSPSAIQAKPEKSDSASTGEDKHRMVVRPSHPHNNEVSFIRAANGMIAEVIWNPKHGLHFCIRNADGKIEVGRRCDEHRPLHWLADYARDGDVHLASGIATYKFAELAKDIRDFIHRYVEVDSVFESVATMFVLMTWIYDEFHAVPYLRFLGPPESGKTRASETIGSICYRTITIAGAATAAPLYHLIEAIGGTLFIDEADFRDSTVGTDIAKILNCGYQRGLSVKRMDKTEDGVPVPRRYEVFGPKIINGRKRFEDHATETRCLTHQSKPMIRTDIAVHLPSEFLTEAGALTNKLLAFRMQNLGTVKVSLERIPDISSRMNQIIAPLLTVAAELPGTSYREDLIEFARRSNSKAKVLASESAEAAIVQVLLDAPEDNIINCKDVCGMIDDDPRFKDIGKWIKPRHVGRIVRDELGLETEHREQGTVINFTREQLKSLAKRYGLTAESVPRGPSST